MLMKTEKLLEHIGLTKNEVKVYLALLDTGLTTTSAIIKETCINTSKVYESLERLLKKGLVSYTTESAFEHALRVSGGGGLPHQMCCTRRKRIDILTCDCGKIKKFVTKLD